MTVPLLAVLLVVAILLPGCAPRAASGPARNVLFVVVDTLRSDRVSAYGYAKPTTPNLDRLAAEGQVFLRHYSQSWHTRASMQSLNYSRYFVKSIPPHSRRVSVESVYEPFQQLDPQAISLPEVMTQSGRRTVLLSAHRWLDSSTEFASLFDEAHDVRSNDPSRRTSGVEQMVSRAIEWIDDRGRSPFYLHLHLMDVHAPRRFGEEAAAMLPSGVQPPETGWQFSESRDPAASDTTQIEWLNAAYDGMVNRVDRELGRLVDHLRRIGRLDDTLIVITSDHGENLGEPGRRVGHSGPMYETVARVPLIFHHPPTVAPLRSDALTSSVDVMPTILGLLGLELDPGRRMDGRDLARASILRDDRPVLSRHMVRQGNDKLLVDLPLTSSKSEGLQPRPLQLLEISEDADGSSEAPRQDEERVAELLTEYRRGLERPFARYLAARADKQPEGSFALSPSSLWIRGEGALEEAIERAGWRHLGGDGASVLVANESSGPLELSFPLPSGLYQLYLSGKGPFELTRTDGGCGSPHADRARPFKGSGLRNVGLVRVCEASLTLVVTPQGENAIQLLSFAPLGGDSKDLADPERDRDLRSLGYIN